MRIFNVIKKTILTEKTYKQMEGKKKFVFEVAKDASKTEIKNAFETLFEIKVDAINTHKNDGKPKTLGRYSGRKNHRKIAIITVKDGQNLDVLMQQEEGLSQTDNTPVLETEDLKTAKESKISKQKQSAKEAKEIALDKTDNKDKEAVKEIKKVETKKVGDK